MGSKGIDTADSSHFAQIRALLEELRQEDTCLAVKDLAINGRDLLALGFEPGPKIGMCLQKLLAQVQDEQLANEAQALLNAAADYLNR